MKLKILIIQLENSRKSLPMNQLKDRILGLEDKVKLTTQRIWEIIKGIGKDHLGTLRHHENTLSSTYRPRWGRRILGKWHRPDLKLDHRRKYLSQTKGIPIQEAHRTSNRWSWKRYSSLYIIDKTLNIQNKDSIKNHNRKKNKSNIKKNTS